VPHTKGGRGKVGKKYAVPRGPRKQEKGKRKLSKAREVKRKRTIDQWEGDQRVLTWKQQAWFVCATGGNRRKNSDTKCGNKQKWRGKNISLRVIQMEGWEPEKGGRKYGKRRAKFTGKAGEDNSTGDIIYGYLKRAKSPPTTHKLTKRRPIKKKKKKKNSKKGGQQLEKKVRHNVVCF